MQLQSKFLQLTAGVAICTGLLVAVAQGGQVRDHRSGQQWRGHPDFKYAGRSRSPQRLQRDSNRA
jgi:hypothetical protein